jgi:hypothetical protein
VGAALRAIALASYHHAQANPRPSCAAGRLTKRNMMPALDH